jgi:hypothetical protein
LSLSNNDLSYMHPMQPPRPEFEQLALAVPQEARDRTYMFFLNGLDPYWLANFGGMSQYMKTLGYSNAYCGHMSQRELFRTKIGQVRQQDPQARIVIVGYSAGAVVARTLANELKTDKQRIDLLVYLGGDTLKDGDRSRPDNVTRILNITAHGFAFTGGDLIFRGVDIKGASNHRLDLRHFMLPTRPEVMELLIQHIVEMDRSTLADVRGPGASGTSRGCSAQLPPQTPVPPLEPADESR